jgi:hypothetical protein
MADMLNNLTPFKAAEKLKIESWTNPERQGSSTGTFDAFINPDEITLNYAVISESTTAPGGTGNAGPFLGTTPFEVTLKFYLDGTNTSGIELKVEEKVRNFYETTGYDGKGHRTKFLRITWSGLVWYRANQFAFDCILKSASINYKLFRPDGTPLRAIINAVFVEKRTEKEVEKERDNQSADLTHVRVVKEGDTLPGLVHEIYGNFKYYLEVAKANHLSSFRDLRPGTQLVFPPFDKNLKRISNV